MGVAPTAAFDPEQTSAMPHDASHWSPANRREKLTKFDAKVVNHDRYVAFQVMEVAVARERYRKNLSLIDDLPRRPAPA